MEQQLYIVWEKEYDLGIRIIDEQHRGVISILNSFFYCLKNDSSAVAARSTYAALAAYSRHHFITEEALMRQIDFPGLEEHRRSHAKFTEEAEKFASMFNSNTDAWELVPVLKRWWQEWLRHMKEEDDEFVRLFLKQHSAEMHY